MISKRLMILFTVLVLLFVAGMPLMAQEGEAAADGERSPLAIGLIAIAAALAVGLPALATGIAQSRIGAAGAGTMAEKPETAGTVIVLVALPETIVILGFVVGVVMLFTL